MTCGAGCKHWALWERASAACACCVNAQSHHGLSRLTASDFTLAQPRPIDYSTEPSRQVTNLPADIEDKFRRELTDIFALDPIDTLLIGHIIQQRPLVAFRETLKQVADKYASLHGSKGAMAHARKKRLLAKLPILARVIDLRACQSRTKG